jgi:hypothetical protein
MTPSPSTGAEAAGASSLCIDLCSGLGGFCQAFVDAGWEVITVDIEPRFNPTVCADITKIDWTIFKRDVLGGRSPDVLLASPPCERLSIAGGAWPAEGIGLALAIVGACLEAVVALEPKRWVVENPKARLRWFIGKPRITIRQKDFGGPWPKPTDLWGNIVLPMVPASTPPMKGHGMGARRRLGVPVLGSDSAKNAIIAPGLSQAILEAVTLDSETSSSATPST